LLKLARLLFQANRSILLFAPFVFAAVLGSPAADLPAADLVVLNSRIYTVDSRQPWAEALAISGAKIVAVGNSAEISRYRGSSTKVIDGGGRLVLPGFTDSHIHLLEGGETLTQLRLDDTASIADVQRRLKEFAAAHPEKKWILGRGWYYPIFGAAALPDKKYLDEVLPDRPVYLECFDGHTWWANSKALQLAGITRQTPDPPGGFIVRDPKSGEPTGAIKEDSADALIERAIPLPTREEKLQAIRAAMKEANQAGLVRGHGCSDFGISDDDLQNVDLFDELRRKGELTVRMYLAHYMRPPSVGADQLQEIEDARRRYHDEWISAGAAKFYLDGVIESHTAAMLAPYSDDPSRSGDLIWDPASYKSAVADLDRRGVQIFTHAIGDRAIRLALDAYENAAKINHTTDARPRIEHIEDVSKDDIPRFGKLGVIASFQPLHAYPEEDTLQVWARNVGPERAQRAWAWHSIESTGGKLAFGSDWPVVTLNPWRGVQNALTRQTLDGNPPDGFVAQERVTLEDAIRAYTLGAAFAGRREKTEGSLEPGKVADLIILSQDLFNVPPSKISDTQVLLTMVGGKVVYQSPTWQASTSPVPAEAHK
jgi:predicted amidohydrolase YtcJ